MTLYRQLVLAITFLIICLMAGNVFVSVFNARGNIFEQIQVHAQDTATSLGLTVSHVAQDKDEAQIGSFIDVVFDRGYYREISYKSLSGDIEVVRQQPILLEGVPEWFVELIELPLPTGQSEVVSGWFRLGEIKVVTHPGYAYRDLWRVFNEQLWLFLVTAVLSYGVAGLGLKFLLQPLRKVEEQADAICRREFPVQETLPRTPELKRMVMAMNRMVKKIQAMFQEQIELTESLHRQAYLDPVTQMSNRRDFDSRFDAFMKS
ncbi:MAG: LapD/MoxY N-terminal periplasmic domain-containing protein [Pseudomonadota bacterium]|nr:LapD/MoxY N-terminal periplasmic domain-containing protein [Pseudomonadota bacterium]